MSDEQIVDDFITQIHLDAMGERVLLIEERIKLVVQPRPRWLPDFLWRRVLQRVFVIQEQRTA